MTRLLSIFTLAAGLLTAVAAQSGTVVDEVLARVGNDIITRSEYDHEAQRMHDDLSRKLQGQELETEYAKDKKGLLDALIDQKLLEQKAAEMGLNPEEDINAAIKRLREENNIPDDQALEQALKQQGSSMAELRNDFRRRIIQQRILWNYVQGKVNITEEEIKSYYEKNKDQMVTEPVTRLARFVVADTEATKDSMKQEANQVLSDLKAGKQLKTGDYPHLTVDETADFKKSEIDPKLAAVIDPVAVGGVTDPIEISTGWLIVKVDERRPSKPISLEDARGNIYNALLSERADKYQKDFLQDLRKESYVVIKQTPS